MRQRAKQNNGKKKISGLIFVLVFFVLIISFVQAVGADKKDGFFWIGNNSYENGDKGEATIGMIKVSGSDYGLTIEQEKENKAIIDGRAWMGIGFLDDKVNDFTDQKDHPSLGWIKFNQSTPTDCGEMLNKDCNPATWHRKTGAPTGSMEGYLSGWAKVELGKNGDGENYPETWVYFKPPVDKSGFSCTKNENLVRRTKDYYACTDNEGYLFGYAWSSELKALTLKDNSGLGWINFNLSFNNCEENGICNKNCSADPDCLCTVTKNFPTSDSIKPNEPVEYKATIKDSAPITPISYQWFCDKTTEISDIHTVTDKTDINICKDYVQPERIYEPKVIFNYKEGAETKSTTCMNNGVKVKVSPPVPLPPDPCQENGVCNLECEEGKDPDCLCRVRKLSPQDDFITPNSPVKYQAKAEGPITPINYQWFCDKNATNDFKNHPSSSMVDEQIGRAHV